VRTERALARSGQAGVRSAGGTLLVVGILVLALNLRAAITGLPPVFPELEHTLGLSSSSLAVLAALPVLCFGVFSGAAAPISRRFGEERVLAGALILLAAGLLARSVAPPLLVFPGTIVAGCGVALMNVLLPSLVKRRMPERAGLLIGAYLLSLCAGAIVGSLFAVPLFAAAGGGQAGARLALGLWAGPALVALLVWLPQVRYSTMPDAAPAPPVAGQRGAGRPGGPGALAMRRHALAWQVTLFMGLQSLSYYAALSWFPTMFRDRGVSAAHAGALLALMNLGNGITALLIPVLAHRAADQRWLACASVAATGAGLAGVGFGPGGLAAGFVLLLGLGQGATLGLGIYYTMARAPDPATAASLSAFAQGIGYLIASTGPLLIEVLHRVTGGWTVPLSALLGLAVLQLVTGWLAGRPLTIRTGSVRVLVPDAGQ
jgi:MFS transporter, CP family, cyanate transporter